MGRDLINIGSAKSVRNTDKRRRLLPPLEIDVEPGKSLINKLEGVIGELRCKLKDLLAKQADAIECCGLAPPKPNFRVSTPIWT